MIAFIDRHREAYGVEPICGVLPIAPSTHHDHVVKRSNLFRLSDRARRDTDLKSEIRRVLEAVSIVTESDRAAADRPRPNSERLSSHRSDLWRFFGNWGLGPYSRMAGLLLFPLRPFRRNRLSATTGFRFQGRRNRFACPNVLLRRFSG